MADEGRAPVDLGVDRDRLAALVRDVADFPEPGVTFKDVTPLLADPEGFRAVVDALVRAFRGRHIDKVVGIEARGFILAAPVAYECGAGFVPARKAGKLPHDTHTVSYELEYGSETLEMHLDGIRAGDQVLIVDDVLATGGTAHAAVEMVEALDGEVVGLAFLIELGFLGGAARIADHERLSLLTYP